MNELASSGLTVKSKYEEYRYGILKECVYEYCSCMSIILLYLILDYHFRQQLYEDSLNSVEHTRHKVAASIAALKEKLAGQAVLDEQRLEGVKGEAVSEIQRENTQLTNTVNTA